MKSIKTVLLLSFLGSSTPLLANDGGVYSIQPYGAKFDKPSKTLTFTGEFAARLKELLPPAMNVITTLTPSLKAKYEKNYRDIFIRDAQGLGLNISCRSAEVIDAKTIKELSETTCSLEIVDSKNTDFGDVQAIPVKEAFKKADDANKLK